jgi:hypothetical protein
MFLAISSTLKGLIFKTPPKALLQPENSDKITADLPALFRAFFTVMNSKGGIHYPSLRVVIRRMFETLQRASLCSISKSCS